MIYTLPHIIERSARLHPNREAFRCGTDAITYSELDQKTNQLAKYLVDNGIKKGNRVGIFMNRCIETSIAIYGIMKSGAAYVPLDTGAPNSRTRFLIQDCSIQFIVTTEKQKKKLPKLLEGHTPIKKVLGVSEGDYSSYVSWDSIFGISLENFKKTEILSKDLAYIMYTSGSTGAPKGIMHTHDSGLAYAKLSSDLYEITPKDRVANHAPIHFDISTFGYFSAPLKGATTILITDAHTKLPASLAALISEEKISVWYSVPLALSQLWLSGMLHEYDFRKLRWVLYGGENFTIKHLKELLKCWPTAKFSNVYGPAEVNQCSYYHFDRSTNIGDYVPIGKIWSNTEYKILNSRDQEVEAGESGELVIRSASMMLGYWNNKALTEKAFFSESISSKIEKTFYRTGDLVQRNENKELVFLGRIDRQIKLRGYRIELDEVEAVLERHNFVKEAAVCVLENEHNEKMLSAAVILMPKAVIDTKDLLMHCKSLLPLYAVPTLIEILNEFPRTGSGKVDLTRIKEKLIAL